MGIGHVAVGLGLKCAGPRLNAGLLVFSAFFADFLLGWFVLAGWESYQYPPDYASKHYILFTFPWSHGLLPDLVWGTVLGLLVWLLRRERRAALMAGLAAVSHFLLDGIVHVKGLPVAGPGTYEFGLGLWKNLPVESTLEAAMTVAALFLYLRATRDHSRARRIGMVIYAVLLGALAIAGQATATVPAPRNVLIANWIAAPVVMSLLPGWIDRRQRLR